MSMAFRFVCWCLVCKNSGILPYRDAPPSAAEGYAAVWHGTATCRSRRARAARPPRSRPAVRVAHSKGPSYPWILFLGTQRAHRTDRYIPQTGLIC